jgi:hypothetical protein
MFSKVQASLFRSKRHEITESERETDSEATFYRFFMDFGLRLELRNREKSIKNHVEIGPDFGTLPRPQFPSREVGGFP